MLEEAGEANTVVKIKNRQDFWSGCLFLTFAALFFWQSASLNAGTAFRMGPAYMPRILCAVLVAMSGFLFYTGLTKPNAEPEARTEWRALFPLLLIPLSICVFAAVLSYYGLMPAVFLTVIFSSIANRPFRLFETLVLAVALSAFTAGIFVYGLKLNIPLWPS